MFNFDEFINKPSIGIFGRNIIYIPANNDFEFFTIKGDFHKNYQEVKPNNFEVEISSNEIVIFIRDVDMASSYPKANQGDFIKIDESQYQIIDIQNHIPGSKKLILHESPTNSN